VDPTVLTAGEYRAFNAARRKWLQEHGINPGDFNATQRVVRASELAYDLPERSALGRARRRAGGASEVEQRCTAASLGVESGGPRVP
jgi:hypothetical protein